MRAKDPVCAPAQAVPARSRTQSGHTLIGRISRGAWPAHAVLPNKRSLIQVKSSRDKIGTMQDFQQGLRCVESGEGALERSEWEVTWSNSLCVDVPEMDEEHRQFIARVNELNQAILESEDKATVARAMELMLSEAAHHFAHEEELLARWAYPDAAAHTARHAAIMAQFERVMKEFADTDISFVWALKGLRIKQLLVEHLLKEDMKYRDFLRGRAGSPS